MADPNEPRVRRLAQRQELALQRSRTRNEQAADYGLYRLVDPFHNTVVAGAYPWGYSFTLDEVEQWLTEPDAT